MATPIPVTVIGGYLGAGKTTLVNRLLRAEHGERIAVLVNDFGSVAVDSALIESDDGTTIQLSNGCVCCSLAGGFVEAVERVGALEPRPDRLVVETSGVADPAAVAEYAHLPGLVLDAVVVLADAETIRERADDALVGRQVRAQLAGADVVVINKVDLLGPHVELDDLVTWVAQQAPDAHLATAVEAGIDRSLLWARPGRPEHPRDGRGARGQRTGHEGNGVPGHVEHPSYTARTIVGDARVTRAALESALDELTTASAVARLKGFVELGDGDRLLVQVVGRRRRIVPATAGARAVELVVIGLADSPTATSVDDAARRLAHRLGATVVDEPH